MIFANGHFIEFIDDEGDHYKLEKAAKLDLAEAKYVPGPPQGQARSNVRIGGVAKPCTLSPRDAQICRTIKPKLLDMGIHLAGIDIIGDYLTEINVTSPTGMRLMNRMYQLDLAVNFWEGAEKLYLEKNR